MFSPEDFFPDSLKSRVVNQFTCGSWEARWPHGYCARLRSERSGFEPWPGTLCCVLGQDTLLSQCLSPPRCINGYQQIVGGNLTNCGEVTCDGLTSRPGKVEILPAATCYRIRDKLRQLWASLGSKVSLSLCASCRARYIGETNRHFNTRGNEHLFRDKNSHNFKHLSASKGSKD